MSESTAVSINLDKLVDDVVAPASHGVDRDARFPAEAIDALAGAGLLNAALPAELGGAGLDLAACADVARRLARGCGATSMVWAMHQIQVACVADAATPDSPLGELMRGLAGRDALVASVTSEVGVGGNIRESRAAVAGAGDDRVRIEKRSPTISYAEHADAYLVTARRTPDSPPDDQVSALVLRDQVTLEATGQWDAMGMRGTVSPGFGFDATFDADQVLPVPFAETAPRVMVPWSHILWASCWYGLALEAYARAGRIVRKKGTPDMRLAEAGTGLSLLKASITEAIDHLAPAAGPMSPLVAMRLNDLKVTASRIAVDVARTSLEVAGMAGYQERTPFSIARILRDLYSARLMIANERILTTNAQLAPARGS